MSRIAISVTNAVCFRYFSERAIEDFSKELSRWHFIHRESPQEFEIIMILGELQHVKSEVNSAGTGCVGSDRFRRMQLSSTSRMHFASRWRTFSFATSAKSAVCFQNFDL